ncbi:GNAT family N-acetyltransferase [Bifidobacterium samirii]|uniref:Acetyltransferase n=1 Tax=Bifidobacterium samirii TaxID=2306974 RepID=A0A430FTN2_9BIFI|nr:GNAT family protein [Bifidobacterium samirii]RSX56241.1 acetyltransferase [Bifidobacterium samirii]
MSETIETERLLLRPWRADDRAEAESLFGYASDQRIGPLCGWPPHGDVEESMGVIRNVFSVENNWAVTIRDAASAGVGVSEPVGCIDLKPMRHFDGNGEPGSMIDERYVRYADGNVLEVGYWVGCPFWGKGYMPEALRAVFGYAFDVLHVDAVWGAHYVENTQSGRVMEKCGMTVAGQLKHHRFPLIGEYHDETLRIITADEWKATRSAASAVR